MKATPEVVAALKEAVKEARGEVSVALGKCSSLREFRGGANPVYDKPHTQIKEARRLLDEAEARLINVESQLQAAERELKKAPR